MLNNSESYDKIKSAYTILKGAMCVQHVTSYFFQLEGGCIYDKKNRNSITFKTVCIQAALRSIHTN